MATPEFRYRVSEARNKANMTQQEAADRLEMTLQGYQYYEYGKRDIKASLIRKMSDIFGVSAAYLLGLTNDDEQEREYLKTVEIPLYGSIAAGEPIEMISNYDTYPVPEDIHDRYPKAFLLKVAGESMNRVLPNGCYALINPCDTVERPMKAYAVCVNGFDATIKRVKVLENGYELIPDSNDPTFRPQIYDYNEPDTDPVTVIGQVVWYMVPFGFEI